MALHLSRHHLFKVQGSMFNVILFKPLRSVQAVIQTKSGSSRSKGSNGQSRPLVQSVRFNIRYEALVGSACRRKCGICREQIGVKAVDRDVIEIGAFG
jgi:hypothetical protein